MTNRSPKLPKLAAAAAVLAAALAMPPAVEAAAKKLTVITFGGAPDRAYRKTIWDDFTKETGIVIQNDTWSGKEFAMVRAQVEANAVEWDLIFADFDRAIQGCEQGFLVSIPKNIMAPADDYLPGAVHECGLPFDVFGSTINYDAGNPPPAWGGKTPTKFMDFWDLKAFPGMRGVRKRAKVTVELALMADGVPNERVYEVLGTPEGVDRAFAKLGSIREHTVFWAKNALAPQLLADGEVVMSTGNSARFLAANEEGRKFEVIWDRMIWSSNTLIVPKGPRVTEALQLLKYLQDPKNMIKATKYITYGPSRKSAVQYVDPARLHLLTTAPDHMTTAMRRNEEFWADHQADINKQWAVWMAK
jgi:putative spermidine/putrescine transport system substrate-binding protein